MLFGIIIFLKEGFLQGNHLSNRISEQSIGGEVTSDMIPQDHQEK